MLTLHPPPKLKNIVSPDTFPIMCRKQRVSGTPFGSSCSLLNGLWFLLSCERLPPMVGRITGQGVTGSRKDGVVEEQGSENLESRDLVLICPKEPWNSGRPLDVSVLHFY